MRTILTELMLETMGVVCLVIATVFGVAAVRNRKPGIPLQPSWWESPLNHVFGSDVFTARGEKFRIVALLLGAAGVICMVIQKIVWW